MSHPDRPVPFAPTGQAYWIALAASLIPIPFFNALITAIVQLVMRPKAKRLGGLAEPNSRNALNWSLTWLLVTVLAPLTPAIFVPLLGNPPPGWVTATAFVFIGLYLLGCAVSVIWLVIGAVRGGDHVVRCPLAIPFVRAPR